MKNLSRFATLLLVIATAAAAAPTPPQPLPPTQWARTRNVDIQHLDLDLRFDEARQQAHGRASLRLAPLAATQHIALDAAHLKIESITLPDGTPLKFSYDGGAQNDALAITLDRRYRALEVLTVHIDYRTASINRSAPNFLGGSVGHGLRFFGPSPTEPRRRRQIWSSDAPESNRYWFPGYDAPNDVRTTTLTFTLPEPLRAIATGNLVSTTTNRDDTRSFRFETKVPYSNHRTHVAIGEYDLIEQRIGTLELHNFAATDEVEATRASVHQLPEMVDYFVKMTGQPYPWPRYSQLFVQDLPWGFAAPGMAIQTENMVDDARTHDEFQYLWNGLQAESLAQQWFGGLVQIEDWRDLWLNKGFAHYFSGLYSAHKHGLAEYQLWANAGDHSTYLADWNAGVRRPVVTANYLDANDALNSNYPCVRGALVLHLLRAELGEEKWWRALRHYLAQNANKTVTTDDFRRAIEQSTGESIGWFFEQWLYRIGHPVFDISQRYDESRRELKLTVKQTQQVDPVSAFPTQAFFAGKMLIGLDNQLHPIVLKAHAENVFTFALDAAPKLVSFDHGNVWIKEVTFEKTPDELRWQLHHDSDLSGRNAALLALMQGAAKEPINAAERQRTVDSVQQLALSDAYWRLRYNAVVQLGNLLAPATEPAPARLDPSIRQTLISVIKNDSLWLRAAAIHVLGRSRDPQYAALYRNHFADQSDRVINAAAIALGKTAAPGSFEALVKLIAHPSWKNQSRISALNGMGELKDPRAVAIADAAIVDSPPQPRWTLATPVWDFRLSAADTLRALKSTARAERVVRRRLSDALAANDRNDIFSNALLLATLADTKSEPVFAQLQAHFANDKDALAAVESIQQQYQDHRKTTP